MKKEIHIEGTRCQNCVKHVTKALENLEETMEIHVSLDEKKAFAQGPTAVTGQMLKDAIAQAGYTVTSIITEKTGS